MKNVKWQLFAISCCLLISACTVRPPDVPACEHLAQRLSTDPLTGHLLLSPSPTCMKQIGEAECGHCVTIISGKEFFVGEKETHHFNGKPWSKLRAESVYLPAKESYSKLAAYAIKACKKMNCSKDVTRFRMKLDALSGVSAPVMKTIDEESEE